MLSSHQARRYLAEGEITDFLLEVHLANSTAGQRQRLHHRPRLVDGFLVFAGRVRIGHDAGAGLEVCFASFQDRGSQDDAGIDVAIESDITDGAGITAAPGFNSLMICIARIFSAQNLEAGRSP